MHALKFCRQDSSPVVFHFFSVLFCLCIAGTRKNGLDNGMIVLTTKQNPDKFMFFIKIPDKILQKLFKCKTCPVKLSLCFLQFFLTEKLNLIKRLKFGRFLFFGLAFFVACRQSVFHCLQKVCFLLHEVLKHRQIPNWNLACKFCRHAL